jgi:hypothetical protein
VDVQVVAPQVAEAIVVDVQVVVVAVVGVLVLVLAAINAIQLAQQTIRQRLLLTLVVVL